MTRLINFIQKIMADKKEQGNENYYRYLSDQDFEQLEKYKHYAPKTAYELWLIEKTGYIERAIPCIFTANFITIVGNLSMYSYSVLEIYYGGYSYHYKDS